MSYTPTEWKNGDIISAEKMNKIQEGIENLSMGGEGGGNEFVINRVSDETREGLYLDKSFSEILDAIRNGLTPVIYEDDGTGTDGTYIYRDKYIFSHAECDDTYVGEQAKNNQILFVSLGFYFNVSSNTMSGQILYLILLGDDTLKEGSVTLNVQ